MFVFDHFIQRIHLVNVCSAFTDNEIWLLFLCQITAAQAVASSQVMSGMPQNREMMPNAMNPSAVQMMASVKGNVGVGSATSGGGGVPVGLNPNASALLAQQQNQNQMNAAGVPNPMQNMQRQQQEQQQQAMAGQFLRRTSLQFLRISQSNNNYIFFI